DFQESWGKEIFDDDGVEEFIESARQAPSVSWKPISPETFYSILDNEPVVNPIQPVNNAIEPIDKMPRGRLTAGPKLTLQADENTTADDLVAQFIPLQAEPAASKTILINFNNVNIVEFIRFMSRISGKNFIFNEEFLQFNITIVSEVPSSINDMMAALLQELRIRGLYLIEQGNTIIVHTNDTIRGISEIIAEGLPQTKQREEAQLATRVFRLNTLSPSRAKEIISPIISDDAQVDTIDETSHLIVTDIKSNVEQIEYLVTSIDSPNSGLVIGQYVVINGFLESIIDMARTIMTPIAEDKALVFVPHNPSNSIFVVSTPFIVERTLAVLRYLDINVGATRILTQDALRFILPPSVGGPVGPAGLTPGSVGFPGQPGAPVLPGFAPQPGSATGVPGAIPGSPYFQPGQEGVIPEGYQAAPGVGGVGIPGQEGQFQFTPDGQVIQPYTFGVPSGEQPPIFFGQPGTQQFPQPTTPPQPGQPSIPGFQPPGYHPGAIGPAAWTGELPPGHIQRTQFAIYKLRYRDGEQIVDALSQIASSLEQSGTVNTDLIATINSIQWIQSTNSLVFTGIPTSLAKVEQLIEEIDLPLRQVFIEMLILETALDDSLSYSVNWATRFGGGSTVGAQAFISGASLITGALDTADPVIDDATGVVTGGPDATRLARSPGYSLGIIGRSLSRGGRTFRSIGALVNAVHDQGEVNILLNPKIITEDNNTAEIFVGREVRFKTQSVANDRGEIITNNFEFREVGIRLSVTPLISHDDIITLEIQQEVSRQAEAETTEGLTDASPGPETVTHRTTTKVHVPDGFFVVISGLISEEHVQGKSQVPCLGGIPILGVLFKDRDWIVSKTNIMIFMRPKIVDTADELRKLTHDQQDLWDRNKRMKSCWQNEVEGALDFMNLKCGEDGNACVPCTQF
ncbi:MAG: hypothetical protein KDK65_03100, partial [Chlamydiia bacterium]|nr:hypothetical protein [Chlamydiia bacterium]